MININTLNKLDELCIGSSVDKLENYVAMIYYSELMGNCIVADKIERENIIDLLKQLKPNSNVLKYNFNIPNADMNDKDIFLEAYGKFSGETIIDINNINFDGLRQSMQNTTEDLLGVVFEDGIDIRVVYYNGILFQATTFNGDNKGIDITKHVRGLVPNNVDNISKKGITEIHGRLIVDDSIITKDRLKEVVEYLIKEVDDRIKERFTFKAYKIYCEEIEFTALNKEIDFLEDNDFNTADYLLIRTLSSDDLEMAIESMYDNICENDSIIELRICVNTNNALQYPFENRDDIININKKAIKSEVYTSVIKDIEWILDKYVYKPRLIIKPIKINDTAIRHIDINNINIIDSNNISIESEVCFYIDYNNKVVACDKIGNKLV